MMKVIHHRPPSFDSQPSLVTTMTSASSSKTSKKNAPTVPERQRSATGLTGLTAFGDASRSDEEDEEVDQVEDEDEEVDQVEVDNRVHGGGQHDTLGMCAGHVNGGTSTSCTSRTGSTSTLPSPRSSSRSNSNNVVSTGFAVSRHLNMQKPRASTGTGAGGGGQMMSAATSNNNLRGSSTSTTPHTSIQIQMRQEPSSRSIYTDGPPSFPSQHMSPTVRTSQLSSLPASATVVGLGGIRSSEEENEEEDDEEDDEEEDDEDEYQEEFDDDHLGNNNMQQQMLQMLRRGGRTSQHQDIPPTEEEQQMKASAGPTTVLPPTLVLQIPAASTLQLSPSAPASVARSRRSYKKQNSRRQLSLASSTSAASHGQPQHGIIGAAGGEGRRRRRSSSTSIDVVGAVQEVQEEELTKDIICAFWDDYFADIATSMGHRRETWELFYEQYYAEDSELVRPSGNSIDITGLCDMMTSPDFQYHGFILVSLDKIRILTGHQTALIVLTADQSFTYIGKYNEDRIVLSVVMELRDGKVKIVHEHRTTGRPIPKQSRWDTTEVLDH